MSDETRLDYIEAKARQFASLARGFTPPPGTPVDGLCINQRHAGFLAGVGEMAALLKEARGLLERANAAILIACEDDCGFPSGVPPVEAEIRGFFAKLDAPAPEVERPKLSPEAAHTMQLIRESLT